jgi:hypothetical protein
MANPPVNWGYPRTVEGFLHVISRGQYEKLNPTINPVRFSYQALQCLGTMGRELGWPGLVLSALPFYFIRRMSGTLRLWMLGLTVIWIGVGPVLLAELNPPPDRQAQELVAIYFAASHAIVSVWLGLGLLYCGSIFVGSGKQALR